MSKHLKFFVSLIALLSIFACSKAQYTPLYRSVVTLTESDGQSRSMYPVRFTVNTQSEIAANRMQADGDDIRFFADSCRLQPLDYWIQDSINTGNTLIWVLLDTISDSSSRDIYMYYGDSAATGTSSSLAVFPNQTITAGSITLTGAQTIDYLRVSAGDTLFLTAGAPLTLVSRLVIVDGVVWGKGRGYQIPGTFSQPGTGPGAGLIASPMNSGSGGGGYGGAGGVGCSDAGDTPGAGGAANGTNTGPDINMGSSGGSSDITLGGNGGGALSITADYMHLQGVINLDGNDGVLPGGARGGGAGAGGGLMLVCAGLVQNATISAVGGHGSDGAFSANDGGGGGGGGRAKVFHEDPIAGTGSVNLAGGTPGIYGGIPGGTGGVGFAHTATTPFADVEVAIGSFSMVIAPIPLSVAPGSASSCDGDTIVLAAQSGYASYLWSNGDTLSATMVTTAGTYTVMATDVCGVMNSDSAMVTFNPNPTISVTDPSAPHCEGDVATLMASGASGTTCFWSTSDTTSSIQVTLSGTYSVVCTNAFGCSGQASIAVTFNPLPVPVITQNGADLDAGSGYSSYQWLLNGNNIPAATNQIYTTTGTGIYSVTVTDGNGCSGTSDTLLVTVGIESQLRWDIQVNPNPSDGRIKLSVPALAGDHGLLQVIDMFGKQVYALQIQGLGQSSIQELDLSALASGVYLLRLTTDTGKATLRIILE